MHKIDIFQIDAFTDKVFHGNPAAVCLLDEWLNDELLQAIAGENNLSETAFLLEEETGYQIRWFAPSGEISLCGHATLASGFLLFELGKNNDNFIRFSSMSGPLDISKRDDLLTMDFPRLNYTRIQGMDLVEIINKSAVEIYESDFDYLIVLDNEKAVAELEVDLAKLARLPKRGLIATAPCEDADFYSRCFYPKHRISEDPVTGSAHCVLAPFWLEKLGKKKLRGIQGSVRKGEVICEVRDERVQLSGHCRWYLKGHLMI